MNEAGELENRMLQRLEFEMIEEGAFRGMATEVGFKVKAVFEDYTAKEFDPETGPVKIWDLAKNQP